MSIFENVGNALRAAQSLVTAGVLVGSYEIESLQGRQLTIKDGLRINNVSQNLGAHLGQEVDLYAIPWYEMQGQLVGSLPTDNLLGSSFAIETRQRRNSIADRTAMYATNYYPLYEIPYSIRRQLRRTLR